MEEERVVVEELRRSVGHGGEDWIDARSGSVRMG